MKAAPVTLRRLRRLYGLGLTAQLLPALLLGLPLGSRLSTPAEFAWLFSGVGGLCSALGLWLAWRQSKETPSDPLRSDSRLSAALLLAAAAGVPLLLSSLLWRQPAALAGLLPLGALSAAVSWYWLSLWAARPSP